MNMKIIKSSKGEIHRISNNTVVQHISDGMLGIIRNNIYGDRNIKWKDGSLSDSIDVWNDFEIVQIPKPEGYDNPYEEFYGEGGIFWPLPGTKIRYKGTHRFWFTDIVQNAEDNLEIGKEYTIKSISPASSWCEVKVEEFPDVSLALSFFDYET